MAISAVALSIAVMIIAYSIVSGFQKEVSEKIYGFWGHIQISSFDSNNSYDDLYPASINQDFYPSLTEMDGVKHIQVYANKAGIIRNGEHFDAIVLKGVSMDHDWSFFESYLKSGRCLQLNDTTHATEILVSEFTADRLEIEQGQKIEINIIDKRIRSRKLTVVGIYKTGLKEFDEAFAMVDIGYIQKFNGWEDDQVGGFTVILDKPEKMQEISDLIYYEKLDHELTSHTVKEIYPNIFDWLELSDLNQIIILVLMTILAVINMITALLILILERTNMIGILKALGASNWTIRKIFIINSAYIVFWGLLIGNIVGIGLCLLQQNFGFLKLPEESYYLSVAPVQLDFLNILYLNLLAFFVCVVFMVVPSYLIAFIRPVKAIRFD